MAEVTIRELRNKGGEVIERVIAGEVLTVTRDGTPVAQLVPLPRQPLTAEALLDRIGQRPSAVRRRSSSRIRPCDRLAAEQGPPGVSTHL